MRVKILSDLHLNAYDKFQYIPLDEEVCILAGDIGEGMEGVKWALRNIPNHIRVLYVPGNHEYYGHEYFTLNNAFKVHNNKGTHVRVLLNESEIWGGVKFVGSTLWTNFNYYSGEFSYRHAEAWKKGLNDSGWIKYGNHNISINNMVSLHQDALDFLAKEEGDVLITHYCPHTSVHERWLNHQLTPGFASRIPYNIMSKFGIHIHGHTHDFFDYTTPDGRRTICNPKGNDIWDDSKFQPNFILEIANESM